MRQSYGPSANNHGARSVEQAGLGHILDVIIRPVLGPGLSTGNIQQVRAGGLIDTGASDVCIDYRVAQELNLKQVDQQNVGVVGATIPATVHMGVLEIPELNFSEIMPLYALKVRRPTHDVLLGRSFLKNFIVTFDGPTGLFHFSKPVMSYDFPEFDE